MSETPAENITITDNMVVTLDYELTVDGEVIDRSSDSEPIQFLQGHGQIIHGLEKALYGLTVGESKQVFVPAVEGYGEIDPDDFAEIPLSEFPDEIPLQLGVELQLRDHDGDVFDAYIDEVREETVLLNFNHPMAGKDLYFAVNVVDIRPASEEEIDHGHVHNGHSHD
jgi:FKBP-type peptidyl-prolyl cis-trans isomerase SlyD